MSMQQFLLIFLVFLSSVAVSGSSSYIYQADGQSYNYTVAETGDNFTFQFDRSPGDITEKLAAGYQVLRQIYRDDSINQRYSEHYIRERARCYVYDSRFHTYSLCFLPNDFNRQESDRFWGFVTQMPNWKWLVTRILMPVLIVFGLVFYLMKGEHA